MPFRLRHMERWVDRQRAATSRAPLVAGVQQMLFATGLGEGAVTIGATTREAASANAKSDGSVALDPARLKALRLKRGLSQEAFAEHCFGRRLCVSIASIKRAESGRAVLYRTARHLATAYGVPLEALMPTAPPAAAAAEALACVHGAAGSDEYGVRSVIAMEVRLARPLPVAGMEAIAALVAQFGGSAWVNGPDRIEAAFGAPRAFASDAARCLACANALALRLRGDARAVLVQRAERTAAAAAGPGERGHPSALSDDVVDAWIKAHRDACTDDGPPLVVEHSLAAALVADERRLALEPSRDGRRYDALRPYAEGLPRVRWAIAGRHSQLQQFKALLEDALTMQGGQFVCLRGAAGIGKSRLAREFVDIARQSGFVCHETAVLDFGADSRATPWAPLLRGVLGLAEPSGPAAEDRLQAALAGLAPETAALEMSLRDLLGWPQREAHAVIHGQLEHGVRRARGVEALRALLVRAAMAQPLLLVIEDLHWADAGFLETLNALLPWVRDGAITWVVTTRPDGDPVGVRLRPDDAGLPLSLFDLAPLRAGEAEALALQCAPGDAGHRRDCIERAQGNALFLTQLLTALPGAVLPDSLRHLVQAQLDRLLPVDRRALRAACAIGQQFSLALVREVIGAADWSPESAARARLLKFTAGETGAFVHDLVMQCIHAAMPPAQRRLLHARLAALYRDRDPVLHARHLDRAGDDGAACAYLAAIREQIARHRPDEASDLVALCRRLPAAIIDLYALEMLAGEAASRTPRIEEARAACARAVALAVTPLQRIEANLALAALLNVLDRVEDEERVLDECLPLARELGDDRALARLCYLKGNLCFPRGEALAGRCLHEQALRHARDGGAPELEARALSGLGDSLYAEGRMNRAHAVFSDCLAICARHDLASIEASNLFMRGTTRLYLLRTEEALADAQASAALGRHVGNRRAEIVSRLTAGWLWLSKGKAGPARIELEEGLEVARSMGAARFEPFLGEALARVAFCEGRHSLALTRIVEACETVERLALQRFIGPWLLGTLAVLGEDAAVRDEALRRGRALIERGCVAHNVYRFRVAAAEVALLQGDFDGARREIAALQVFVGADPCAWVDHQERVVHACAEWLAAPSDDTRVALRALRASSEAHGVPGVTPRLDALLRGL